MRPTFDFDRQASAWLADGPTELADRVLDAALREVHLTKQRHRFSMPWRTPLMSSSMRAAAAIGIVTIVGLGLVAFNSGTPGVGSGTPSPTASPTAVPSDSPSPAATVAPSPTQPPVSFTSPLYGYTVSWPSGGGWNVTPATVPWPEQTPLTDGYWDAFRGPAGAYQDFDDVYVAAQPVPEGMTSAAWLLDYAERMAASGRDCKGPVDAWTDAVVGSLAIRRIDLACQEIRLSDVVFVVDGTGYVMTGNREVIALFLDSFAAGA